MNEKETYDGIDQYLKGNLSEVDRIAFESRLQTDENLAELLATQAKTLYLARHAAKGALKDQLKDRFRQNENTSSKQRVGIKPMYWMLAAAAVVILVVSFFIFSNQKKSPEKLFASHFELLPPPEARSGDAEIAWEQAVSLYDSQQFPAAAKAFMDVAVDTAINMKPQAHLFAGISYLMVDKSAEAVAQFKHVDPGSSYIQDAQWYLALAYLQSNNMEEAKLAFQEIVDLSRHYKQPEAVEILKNLYNPSQYR